MSEARGRLSIVGTPIGNLEDITRRAVRTLGEATTICCEDTRRTRQLLSALAIPAPRLVRLDRHNEAAMVERVAEAIERGEVVVLVSDAGMPTISDPGSILVKGIAGAGLPTEVVPGPCAVSAALALSGLPASQYAFAGFLPRKGAERKAALAALAHARTTTVVYEAPGRVARTVADLVAACQPDRELVAARELTKLHEETWRGPLRDAAQRFDAAQEMRGEWVLILGPAEDDPVPVGADQVAGALAAKLAAGADRKQAVAEVASELAVPKRDVYDAALTLKS